MSIKKLNVLVATTATPHFPVKTALEYCHKAKALFSGKSYNVLFNLNFTPGLITEYRPNDHDGLAELSSKNIDLLVIIQGTFTWDNIMMRLADTFPQSSILIWALPESGFASGVLELNSLCGALMNANALKNVKRKHFMVYGDLDNPETVAKAYDILLAAFAVKNVRDSRYGMIGYRPSGFYSSIFDELGIRKKFRIITVHEDLVNLLDSIKEIDPKRVEEDIMRIKALGRCSLSDDESIKNSSRLYLVLKDFFDINKIDFAGIKCWPELMKKRLNPCLANARFTDEGLMTSCEEDFNGALSMRLLYLLQQTSPWFADLIHIDPKKESLYFWHCGSAPKSLCHSGSEAIVNKQFRSPDRCCTLEFPLKEGEVTIARVTSSPDNQYGIFAFRGKAVSPGFSIRGNCSEIIPEVAPHKLLDMIIEHGAAHHYAIIYGDVAGKLQWLAKLLDIDLTFAERSNPAR